MFTAAWSVSGICPARCQPIRGQLSVIPDQSEVRGGGGGPCGFSLITSPSRTFGFGTSLVLGFGTGGMDLRLVLVNSLGFVIKGFK